MASKAKAKKERKPARFFVRFEPSERDLDMLDFLSRKKNLTYSSVIRLALAECAERSGLSLVGQDSGQFKTPLHSSPVEASRV